MNSQLMRAELFIASMNGVQEQCVVEYQPGVPIEMIATSALFGRLVITADDLFGAVCQVRLETEKHGFLLLCNAARKDAYPSRMTRQMGRGEKIYSLVHGVQARKEDMIDLFTPANYGQVTTVAEQKENFDMWLNSLG